MDDRTLLLRAILNEPLEDAVRLAYADWLDENATCEADCSRAEFIRLMIAKDEEFLACSTRRLFATREERSNPEHPRGRAESLLLAHERKWLPPWWSRRSRSTRSVWHPWWSRGFLWKVEIGRVDLLRYGTRLFAAAPITVIELNPLGTSPWAPDVPDDPYCASYARTEEEDLALAWGRKQAGLQPLRGRAAPRPLRRPSARWPWTFAPIN